MHIEKFCIFVNANQITMKRTLLLAICCIFYSVISAQKLIVQHNEKGLFLSHTVKAKESLFGISRMYNSTPKEVADFNGLDITKGLLVGQTVHVPLNSTNFSQEVSSEKPVYYVVGQKEGLYRVSVNNNKVQMTQLRKWNNLASDNITPGQKLVVGFLKTGENINTPVENITVQKKEADIPAKTDVTENKKEQPVVKNVVLEEPLVEKKEPAIKTVSNKVTTNSVDGNGGYFKSQFDLQIKVQPVTKDESATAGIFKTASGWQDEKYYALIDNVETGTIIKITNPNNNKSIYAKVLDKMSGIRQNQGYDLRLSNAAANVLDIDDTDKFFVRVQY